VLFCTEFVDGEGLNGRDDTRWMDGICDFWWGKFVMFKRWLMV